MLSEAKQSEASTHLVMLSAVKHPYWIPRFARNDTALVMLSEAKHPRNGFLAALGMTQKVPAMTRCPL